MQARVVHRSFHGFSVTSFGPLAENEKDRIDELAEGAGLAAWSIAKCLGRHPSTVAWYMTKIGLKKLSPVRKAPFTRRGRRVMPFTDEEDNYITKRSIEGAIPAQIQREMAGLFPHQRSRDTISCRLMMLASDQGAREAA